MSEDELQLVMGNRQRVLRTLSLHTGQLIARELTSLQVNERVMGVAYHSVTDTLLLFVQRDNYGTLHLMSFRRDTNGWLEVHQIATEIAGSVIGRGLDITVCNSRVLLGDKHGGKLHVFDVNAEHRLSYAYNVPLLGSYTWFNTHTCTLRGNDTLVAFNHGGHSKVSFQLLVSISTYGGRKLLAGGSIEDIISNFDDFSVFLTWVQREALKSPQSTWMQIFRSILPLQLPTLKPIASFNLNADLLQFRGEMLLVSEWNSTTVTDAIVSYSLKGNKLTNRQVLLYSQDNVYFNQWALAGDILVISEMKRESNEWKQGDLLLYEFE